MKAHKVPATYYSGWNAIGFKHSFYMFYTNDLRSKGILKSYRNVDVITNEHSYFMEEDFYYIDLSIKGISFKLKKEISDFLCERAYKIQCIDTLSESDVAPTIVLDDYDKVMTYIDDIDMWIIENSNGQKIKPSEFLEDLNNYIFQKVGVIIEEDYFANYLEDMWNSITKSILDNIVAKKTGDNIVLDRRMDLLEFFVIQYLRMDTQIKPKIEKVLAMTESVFIDMGADATTITSSKENGLLSYEPYFFGPLLDAARGDKRRLIQRISNIDSNYEIDVLSTKSKEFLTSTNPCVFSKIIHGDIVEMLFPITRQMCIRFRKKTDNPIPGKYLELTDQEVSRINACVIATADDIVISSLENISDLL